MIKKIILLLLIVLGFESKAQVGINTTTPKAQLEIKSSNETTPTNTDGLLIPKVNTFPSTNPTIEQQGMLVYLTTTVGTNTPGFYFWDNPTVTWIPVKGTDGGTLDQSYDFGGAGLGRTITADAGAVTINGTDGLVVSGTSGSGALAPSGAGTRMVWNPRKAAFRIGTVLGAQWDDASIGNGSFAFSNATASGTDSFAGAASIASGQSSFSFGQGNTASGTSAVALGFFCTASSTRAIAFGNVTTASGPNSMAFGSGTAASNNISTAFGNATLASGPISTAFGFLTTASGVASTTFGTLTAAAASNSLAFGRNNTASSYGETAIGIGATTYTPSTNGTTQFRTANATDRLFVIGNAIDVNNNDNVDTTELSDAMVVLKNGLTRLPSTTNVMIDAADGKAVVTKEYLQTNSSGTLDQAYDFGGAGNGRTITADTGAVTIDGTDGFVSTGTPGSGAMAPSGAGTRMVWNPRKSAFRVGTVSGTLWDDASIGSGSVAFGNSAAIGGNAFAGAGGNASGTSSFAYGFGAIATGQSSFAFGQGASVLGGSQDAIAIGIGCQASGIRAVALGAGNLASGPRSVAIGSSNTTTGLFAVALGTSNTAVGDNSIALGINNTSSGFGETVLGIGATTYTPSTNGATQFRTANATDRLFVIGNAIDSNNNSSVDVSERSDAMVVLKNGLTRLPSTTNVMIDAADGKAVVTKEYLQTNSSGTLDQAYDFGAAGAGRIITADTGAVTIAGTDGLVSTGTLGSGAVAPSGAGTRMVWNPRRAAFRVGNIMGTQWDEANIGLNSTAFGFNNIASGNASVAFGAQNQAIGGASVAYGSSNQASGENSIASGNSNVASGNFSVAIGSLGAANGTRSISLGHHGIAQSFGEIALGIGNTDYVPSTNGATQFTAANETDRLLVVGNAIDTNSNGVFDNVERRDALVILKNGNTGLGVSTPGERLQVAGRALFTNGFSADNAALIYRNNTDYMFLGTQSGSSANGGAMALFGSTNVSGGNAGGIDFNVANGQLRMTSAGNVGVGTTPARKFHVSNGSSGGTSNVNAGFVLESSTNVYQHFLTPNANESGFLFGSNTASIHGGIIFDNSDQDITFRTGGNFNRAIITSTGDVGIGVTVPGGQLELSLNEGRKPTSNTWTIPSDARLKNVNGLYQKGLTEILQLKPIRYYYKNTDKKSFETEVLEKEAYGFLAQEVQQIFPEAIGTDTDGYLNFDLHPILVAYTNAFKELDLKNKFIETKNRELEQKLESQEKIINNLLERLEKLEVKN